MPDDHDTDRRQAQKMFVTAIIFVAAIVLTNVCAILIGLVCFGPYGVDTFACRLYVWTYAILVFLGTPLLAFLLGNWEWTHGARWACPLGLLFLCFCHCVYQDSTVGDGLSVLVVLYLVAAVVVFGAAVLGERLREKGNRDGNGVELSG